VRQAGAGDESQNRRALAELCRNYWYPLYTHVRRCGHPAHDAKDLTQGFFEHLLERQALGRARPERGRFRSFLLVALDNFLADERDKSRAQKRGGGAEALPLDLDAAEQRYGLEPADSESPDRAFDRQCAVALLDSVLRALEAEHHAAGKSALFAALKPALTGSGASQPYGELAQSLGLTEGAVKVAVHRLRQRYRALLRAEIAQTVELPEEIDEEMRCLFHALSGR